MIKILITYASCIAISFASISLVPPVFIGDPDCNAIALIDPASDSTNIYIVEDGKWVKAHTFDWIA